MPFQYHFTLVFLALTIPKSDSILKYNYSEQKEFISWKLY